MYCLTYKLVIIGLQFHGCNTDSCFDQLGHVLQVYDSNTTPMICWNEIAQYYGYMRNREDTCVELERVSSANKEGAAG